MKEIPLTQGKVALVDDEDFEWLSEYRWHATKNGESKLDKFYAARHEVVSGVRKTIYMHRVVLGSPEMRTDHIDGNGLHNFKSNLRVCTHAQNISNQIRPEWKNGFRGVGWRKDKEKWRAVISKDGDRIHIGYFTSKIDAALAYNEVSSRLFGEFAYLNQIPE